jgi:FKBP-type peptidyl-prolyl cis-trans isomerase FklB
MKKQTTTLRQAILMCLIGSLACTQAGATSPDTVTTEAQQQAYSLGVVMAEQARQGLGDIDAGAFVSGVKDAMTGAELALSQEEVASSLGRFEEQRIADATEEIAARAEANRAEGDAFREEFAAEGDVMSLDSGLLYQVVNQGEGKLPSEDSVVTIHYRASFVNGEEFDSSYTLDTPATFPLEGVMKGFSQALSRMPEGSKWKVVIPPELAYGDRGAGPIGPSATLIFELELISVS